MLSCAPGTRRTRVLSAVFACSALLALVCLVSVSGTVGCEVYETFIPTPLAEYLGSTADGTFATAIASFRAALGGLNPNDPVSLLTGRREITWDDVPDALSAPNAFQDDFFNGTVAGRAGGIDLDQGLAPPFSPSSVSAGAANPTLTPTLFANVDPSYGAQFAAFSGEKVFKGSGVTTAYYCRFYLPGSATRARTRAFGVVLVDVDNSHNSEVVLLNGAGEVIRRTHPPAAPGTKGFSFVGVTYAEAWIGTAGIDAGSNWIGPGVTEPADDVVVVDNLIYAEPVS